MIGTMQLRPCPACHRHVSIEESACPFCAGALVVAAPRAISLGRVSRALVFSAGLAACGSNKPVTQPPPDPGNGSAAVLAGDAGVPASDAAAVQQLPDDELGDRHRPGGGGGDGPCCKPYGAPPARRRLV